MAVLLHIITWICVTSLCTMVLSLQAFDVQQCFVPKSERGRTCLFMSPFGTNDFSNPCSNAFVSTPAPQTFHRRQLLWPRFKITKFPTKPSLPPTTHPTPDPTMDPTSAPTSDPSSAPTHIPTKSPTREPTNVPTKSPTLSPTSYPTDAPTKQPTSAPTKMPTNSPTIAPTYSPTIDPTDSPSPAPTDDPTNAPTSTPTVSPTYNPTFSPTIAPTKHPTSKPTQPPTKAPSTSPISAPTSSPSAAPSVSPSNAPTFDPTNAPSSTPTAAPTNAPSIAPTNAPSITPTVSPSIAPSITPSSAPSSPPTAAPSSSPTLSPSAAPTSPPTTTPTLNPSHSPSVAPSAPPTNAPSSSPSSAPSNPPTNAPSLAPTHNPSMAPTSSTSAPTFSPTLNPTNVPTFNPTLSPSVAPSIAPTSSPSMPPTNAPSLFPTRNPSTAPTQPTSPPTAAPSLNPTSSPTAPPSAYPTNAPSSAPSLSPSIAPSIAPTDSPTMAPSFSPSSNPSISPSTAPSLSPSTAPTLRPSRIPSPAPSSAPSDAPSSTPSGSPTQPPTNAPTYSPSATPTASPTNAPSIAPTHAPSVAPSVSPSIAPSIAPTNVPSAAPSVSPSIAPSIAPSDTPSSPPSDVPSLAPSVSPSIVPTDSPTQPPTRVPSSPPTKSPTFPSCLSLSYVLEKTVDGDVIVIEDGEYTMNYGVDIYGLNNVVITGLNVSKLIFDFHAHALRNRTSIIRVYDSHNITFQKLTFSGSDSEQENMYEVDSLILIENSSEIVFDSVDFEHFALVNDMNMTDDQHVDDMIDAFALINIHHIYDQHTTRDAVVDVYSVMFYDCGFNDNVLSNGLLIKSVAYTMNKDTLPSYEGLVPLVLYLDNTYISRNKIYGGLLFAYNTILYINQSVFKDNDIPVYEDNDKKDLEIAYPFCRICIVFDDDAILSHYLNIKTKDNHVATITSSYFHNNHHALIGGALRIHSKVDTDSVIYVYNNTFHNNYANISGGVIHFTSASSNTYYQNTSYCDTYLCGTKLYIEKCIFQSNGINSNSTDISSPYSYKGGVLFIDISHDYSSYPHTFTQRTFYDSEVSIINTLFKNNTVTSRPMFDGGIIYFKYEYIDSGKSLQSAYRLWDILQITSSVFDGTNANIIANGGAIYIEHSEKSTYDGISSVKHINIANTTFTGNKAINGSAIMMTELSSLHLMIANSQFYNNTAVGNIGTVYIHATNETLINIIHCDFEHNTVHNGSGAAFYFNIETLATQTTNRRRRRSRNLLIAGNMNTTSIITPSPSLSPTQFNTAIPTKTPTNTPTFTEEINECPVIDITHSTFYNNQAVNGFGGAIYIQQYSQEGCLTMTHYNTSFVKNEAMEGGAFYLNRGNIEANVTFMDTIFHSSVAYDGSGGALYIGADTNAAEISCNQVTSFQLEITNCNITHSLSINDGAGIFVQCVDITMKHTILSHNQIKSNVGNNGENVKGCVSSECLAKLASRIDEAYGGNGAGIYLYSSSMHITNNIFSNNEVNIGNGAALFYFANATLATTHYLTDDQQKSDMKMIIKDNIIKDNHALWNMTAADTYREPECTDFDGLAGFGGGFWIQLAIDYDAENIAITNNTFIHNKALFVSDLYFDLFSTESLITMDILYKNSSHHNVFIHNINDSEYMKGTSPIYFSNVELLDGGVTGDVCDVSDIGCIGYVLPGDSLFRVLFSLRDYFGQTAVPFLGCSHFTYGLSADLLMKQILVHDHLDEYGILVEFEISEAEYDSREYVNVSDTHHVLISNNSFHVITTLCSAGQEVDISTEGIGLICDNKDMRGVSFKCGKECAEQQYSFTRWEPECHRCPNYGATCAGENTVTIGYAYWPKLRSSNVSLSEYDHDNPHDFVCSLEFDVHLCPAQLCCTNIDGCAFDGYNLEEKLCAKNRNPTINFCGECNEGYSELYGSYECGECKQSQLYLLFIPMSACFMLEIYLLLRNPFVVTPLFTYVYKSLLYFYQILPILTYESYLSLVYGIINLFDLSIITSFNKIFGDGSGSGICLFANLTSYNKLWMNFIIPLILLVEILFIRSMIAIKDWCKSRKMLKQHLLQFSSYDYDDDDASLIEYEPSYSAGVSSIRSTRTTKGGGLSPMSADLLSHDQLASEASDVKSIKTKHQKGYQLIHKHLKQQKKFDPAQRIKDHFKDAVYNTLLIVYIVVCESTIKMFNCAKVENNKWYLWYSGSTACFELYNYVFMGCFALLLLFPFYILYSLFKLRGSLSAWRRIKYPCFTMSYRRKCWYYEAVMMLRRIILISVYAFPKTNQYLLRAIIAFFCGLILTIHVKVLPFRYKINNNLESLLLLLLFLVSALSTVSDTTGLNLKYPTAVIAIMPLLFLPYLVFKYCRRRLIPKVKRFAKSAVTSVRSTPRYKEQRSYSQNDDKQLQTDDYNEYIAPQIQLRNPWPQNTNINIVDNNDDDDDILGEIELAPVDVDKSGTKDREKWYDIIFGVSSPRERTTSEKYRETQEIQKRNVEIYKKMKMKQEVEENEVHFKKSMQEISVCDDDDYNNNPDYDEEFEYEEDDDDIVSDLFLSPAAKRQKVVDKIKRGKYLETQREMREFANALSIEYEANPHADPYRMRRNKTIESLRSQSTVSQLTNFTQTEL